MFFKIGSLKNFTIFTGKHLFGVFNLRSLRFLKGDSNTVILADVAKFLRTAFL